MHTIRYGFTLLTRKIERWSIRPPCSRFDHPGMERGSLYGWHRHADPPRQRRTLDGASHHEPGGERGKRDLSSHVVEALPPVGDGAEGEEACLAVELSEATVLEDRTHLTMHRAAGSTDT